MKVVLLEDVITTGASSLAAIAALKSVGVEPVGVVVLVDRLEGGAEALQATGLTSLSLYTRHDFMPEAPALESTLVEPSSA
jgi:orotate phosphoribosyltransferase